MDRNDVNQSWHSHRCASQSDICSGCNPHHIQAEQIYLFWPQNQLKIIKNTDKYWKESLISQGASQDSMVAIKADLKAPEHCSISTVTNDYYISHYNYHLLNVRSIAKNGPYERIQWWDLLNRGPQRMKNSIITDGSQETKQENKPHFSSRCYVSQKYIKKEIVKTKKRISSQSWLMRRDEQL